MDKQTLAIIQGRIGYHFKEPKLLIQAFTRRSYSEEHGGENNEVLEFLGDSVLNTAVSMILASKYGNRPFTTWSGNSQLQDFNWNNPSKKITPTITDFSLIQFYGISFKNEFHCELDENELSKRKQLLVQKKTLAIQMDDLSLAYYLRMGEGDKKNHIEQEPSVKEDLFEAILGAVALDCSWNFNIILDVVQVMLQPDSYLDTEKDDYVYWIQKWCREYTDYSFTYRFKKEGQASLYIPFDGLSTSWSPNKEYACEIHLTDDLPNFKGFGKSMNEARYDVCKFTYEYLEENGFIDNSLKREIPNPNFDDSISQLEILARRNYIEMPIYTYTEVHDDNGNSKWKVSCEVEGYDTITRKCSSKKQAKKEAAYTVLLNILEDE